MKRLFRSITPKRRRRGDKNKPPKSRNEDPRDFISDDVIARILQLEELMDTEAWNMQMTQELVMLYSVSDNFSNSRKWLNTMTA